MLATNVTGLINMTQAILPIFLARPEGGKGDIINVGSIAGEFSLLFTPPKPERPNSNLNKAVSPTLEVPSTVPQRPLSAASPTACERSWLQLVFVSLRLTPVKSRPSSPSSASTATRPRPMLFMRKFPFQLFMPNFTWGDIAISLSPDD